MSARLTYELRPRLTTALDLIRRVAFDWRPVALALLCALLMALITQLPLGYSFRPGIERGVGSDEPFFQGFYPHEGQWPDGMFRWSKAGEARIELPGVGRRPLLLDLTIVSHRAQWLADAPPTALTLRPPSGDPLSFTLRREGARYQVLVPPGALPDGALRLAVDAEAWQNAGDSRELKGVAIGGVLRVADLRGGLPALPDLRLLWGYPLAIVLLWLTLRLAGFAPRQAMLLLLPLALLLPLLLLIDPPRLGFGAPWAAEAALGGLLIGAVATLAVPPLLRRAGAPAPERLLPWIFLLIVVAFALKYSARYYPDAMPGDMQLHINRYNAMVRGQQYIDAQHRGLPFPFPTGLYLVAAPLTLGGTDILYVFPFVAGLFEASTVLLLYLLLARATGSPRLGLIAAAVYTLSAGGHMTSWYAFFSHVSTQWYALALVLALLWLWPRYRERGAWWLIAALIVQVALGHIGTFINLVVFGLLLVPLLWLRARDPAERRSALALGGAALAGGAFVGLTFYSLHLGQFVDQLRGIATVGMSELTGKRPIPPAESLRALWQGGLINHFGFFPVLLTLPGLLLLRRGRAGRTILPLLIAATLLSSLSQAVLPFITSSSITTRWLMFSAWVFAAAAAPALALLWRRGSGGRLATLAMAGYVGWITVVVWIDAMTMRKPPIEPF